MSSASPHQTQVSAISPLHVVYLQETGADRIFSISRQRLEVILGQDRNIELGMSVTLTLDGNYVTNAS